MQSSSSPTESEHITSTTASTSAILRNVIPKVAFELHFWGRGTLAKQWIKNYHSQNISNNFKINKNMDSVQLRAFFSSCYLCLNICSHYIAHSWLFNLTWWKYNKEIELPNPEPHDMECLQAALKNKKALNKFSSKGPIMSWGTASLLLSVRSGIKIFGEFFLQRQYLSSLLDTLFCCAGTPSLTLSSALGWCHLSLFTKSPHIWLLHLLSQTPNQLSSFYSPFPPLIFPQSVSMHRV